MKPVPTFPDHALGVHWQRDRLPQRAQATLIKVKSPGKKSA
jgi:hypothetical protein